MTSLIGGNSILHIANRLGGIKKEVPNEGQSAEESIFTGFLPKRLDSESAPSPTPPVVRQPTPLSATTATFSEVPANTAGSPAPPPANDESAMIMSLFKEKDTFTASPSTSESATCGDSSGLITTHIDINSAISQMQQHIAAVQQQHNIQNNDLSTLPQKRGFGAFMKNLNEKIKLDFLVCLEIVESLRQLCLHAWPRRVPRGAPPGLRGRSHPDPGQSNEYRGYQSKEIDGVGGVVCLHCSWQGDDRSPNNLRTHLKKFHSSDGVFARFSEKLAQVPVSAPYPHPRPTLSIGRDPALPIDSRPTRVDIGTLRPGGALSLSFSDVPRQESAASSCLVSQLPPRDFALLHRPCTSALLGQHAVSEPGFPPSFSIRWPPA
ncbi:hypothetical protein NECAME_15936 [Necator americanus]|uniref:Uncharacterized protein n=1 Tax=Necator americanus TaxID=51031 RepID=W2SF50_NECAM|nr:hypothetical protein NECAME_15936 [Necator americanus]ETN68244.1 hypothetical protein NECAME_15936 [Necator americanus]